MSEPAYVQLVTNAATLLEVGTIHEIIATVLDKNGDIVGYRDGFALNEVSFLYPEGTLQLLGSHKKQVNEENSTVRAVFVCKQIPSGPVVIAAKCGRASGAIVLSP